MNTEEQAPVNKSGIYRQKSLDEFADEGSAGDVRRYVIAGVSVAHVEHQIEERETSEI
jgi:hypothetical protein